MASLTDPPKRIFEFVGLSINAFPRHLQFIGLDSFNRSTGRNATWLLSMLRSWTTG